MIEKKLITYRFDKIDPMSITDYEKNRGYSVLSKVLRLLPNEIIKEIELSRLVGRGGACYPTAMKLYSVAKETGEKIVICNADEGEVGHFKDKKLMENDPHQIIEGMIIAAYAVGATKGYIYIRGEYQNSLYMMSHALKRARQNNYLGDHILKTDFSFDIEIREGSGAYVCGEEFALIESIEGKAGRTRVKPPFPSQKGLFYKPTLINNVETFCQIVSVLDMGGRMYANVGSSFATGTKLICLSGNVKKPGLYEVPYGRTIRNIIEDLGGGAEENGQIKMAQIGGACGPIIPPSYFDMDIDNEAFASFDAKMGAGAIIVIDERFDLFDILLKNIEFFAEESCGKCAPCREGHIQMVYLLQKFVDKKATITDFHRLASLAEVIHTTTLCGLGQTSPTSILSTMRFFKEDYLHRIEEAKHDTR